MMLFAVACVVVWLAVVFTAPNGWVAMIEAFVVGYLLADVAVTQLDAE